MIRKLGKMTMLALAFSGYTSVTGCSGRDKHQTPVTSPDAAGSITLSLALADGRTISTASYSISGPNGFARTGTIDVSKSTKLTATIGGIPAGMGYRVTLTAATTDASITCGGSAMFDVQAGKTAMVTVPMACHE